MRVLVIKVGTIATFPPAITLVDVLLKLGHDVTLIANETILLPEEIQKNTHVQLINLGTVPPFPASVIEGLAARRKIRSFIEHYKNEYDVVWTTTDVSARDAGDQLLDMCHVMQLAELTETVPLYTHAGIPFKSTKTINYARNAFRVVVPEYNRAHIQKTWWDLKKAPLVLPNKPSLETTENSIDVDPHIDEVFARETRKILLYQGAYGGDRNLVPFAQSLDYLNDEYALYLMGKPTSGEQREIVEQLCHQYNNVHDVGFVAAPRHLAFTHYGHIGLLPYKPSSSGRYSKLNALYCAPNKIWEYSFFGLPMIGADVPGLAQPFKEHGMGLAVDCDNPRAIAAAIRSIEKNYASMSENSKKFFEQTDIVAIVDSIMLDAEKYLKAKE